MLFFFTLIFGTVMALSAYSWMGMWMGLEINLLSIIPLMNSSKNLMSTEASLKYFITQALASTIFLFSMIILVDNFSFYNINLLILMLNSSLLTKMGAAPFHFWFPEVMEGLNWLNCLIMLTWQKLAPMILIIYNFNYPIFFTLIILLSMVVSGLLGLNQISLRKILTYSSINHIGWMIGSMFYFDTSWFWYFIVYTFMSIMIIMIFYITNSFFLKQFFLKMNNKFSMKVFFMMNFLSLGGLPPFIGFLPKWITLQNLMIQKFYFLAFFMVILTLITLFYYLRLIFSSILLSINEMSYQIYSHQQNFILTISNWINLMSLTLSTLIFNLM
uniref:NADH-ubiquinone oxidoreductase chain 2 n=1 Tax=Ischnosoma splendidum TaxID=1143197 RepID=A0A0S2M7F9_9COLE|nr:NADH deshydrogenase subunit 2 [Ischnosoma splendidum]